MPPDEQSYLDVSITWAVRLTRTRRYVSFRHLGETASIVNFGGVAFALAVRGIASYI